MKTGLTRLLRDPNAYLGRGRVGLVANPASIDERLQSAVDLLHAHPDVQLTTLFGPEHGIGAEAQDMIGVDGQRDRATGLPVVSLYGADFESLSPPAQALRALDVLVVDLQDVGSRYYTYAATMGLCMRAAAQVGVRVVVLDRPNPLGGLQAEGGGLQAGLESFVGLYAVPQRHAMTVGELARLYNEAFGIGCELEVVACEGWRRGQYFDATGLPWVMTSPNMPTLDTAVVYPGMCLLEGTNLSEGRGTTRPFELFGAPFIDSRQLCTALEAEDLAGVAFRPVSFQPTFQKWAGATCGGAQLHVSDRQAFTPYRAGLAVLRVVRKLYGDQLQWRSETYEFRNDVPALDLLTGAPQVREAIDAEADLDSIVAAGAGGLQSYRAGRDAALIYDT